MKYELPNGKTVDLPLEKILELEPEDIQYLMSIDAGMWIENPFDNSELDMLELTQDEIEEDRIANLDKDIIAKKEASKDIKTNT